MKSEICTMRFDEDLQGKLSASSALADTSEPNPVPTCSGSSQAQPDVSKDNETSSSSSGSEKPVASKSRCLPSVCGLEDVDEELKKFEAINEELAS